MKLPAYIVRVVGSRWAAILRRVIGGTWADGFVYAGNLAYLSLLTLFPFFIVVATIAGSFGRTDDGLRAVNAFLRTVPRNVAELIKSPIETVIAARSGNGLLTLGVLVTLWTVSGFIETIREIIRRAYGTVASHAAWQYRVGAILLIVGSVIIMVIAFAVQVILTGVEEFVTRLLPFNTDIIGLLGFGRLAPALALFVALWLIFFALTPQKYRGEDCRIWPGPLLITSVWIGTTMALPVAIGAFGSYDLTYGSMAGVVVSLLFFYIIGLGLVIGAQLNAALAIVPNFGQNAPPVATELAGEQGS